jgi:23S rRNA (adenine2503-C2)-methyltransferase
MKVISKTENSQLATVYIAQNPAGKMVEFVESVQPPLTIEEKWVLIVSTLFGCPVDCNFCDAGGSYKGRLSADEILFQIDHPIRLRFPDGYIKTKKFKIQFSRMGEPSFNPAVLEVLEKLPGLYTWQDFVPSLSTIAPLGADKFFEKLLQIKKELYPASFQLQYSLHSTSVKQRDLMIPVRKWDFRQMARYGEKFYSEGGKKITLNFAVSKESIIDESILLRHFSPEIFLVKLTPVNPTFKARKNKIESIGFEDGPFIVDLTGRLRGAGYETIISIGEWEENQIGSNCGQYVQSCLKAGKKLPEAYSYELADPTPPAGGSG